MVDFQAALKLAQATAAKLAASLPAQGQDSSGPGSNKRSRDDYEDPPHRAPPPSGGYRRDDYREHDDEDQRPSSRARHGLGSSERTMSHYGPGSSGGIDGRAPSVVREETYPHTMVGLIIGRKGETLKRIEDTCNVKVQINAPEGAPDGDRRAILTGTEENIQKAREMISDILGHGSKGGRSGGMSFLTGSNAVAPGTKTVQVPVPRSKVGHVIGMKGATIRSLEEQSGAKIVVAADSESDPSSTTRQVTVSGTDDAIDLAKRLIDDVVNSAPTRRPGGYDAGGEKEVMRVPSDKVRLIIGRGGETIRSIQSQARVRVDIEEENGPIRNITVSGTLDGIRMAKDMIEEKINQQPRDGRGSGRYGGGRRYAM
ncbi:hypothetical protein BJ742DRAFT_86383 [Cladochytrium replicatum]|nr:hypothetical protein BJ742DRAFT_86383 [Cladochytrium replicatum]